jgi:hypothetical protein
MRLRSFNVRIHQFLLRRWSSSWCVRGFETSAYVTLTHACSLFSCLYLIFQYAFSWVPLPFRNISKRMRRNKRQSACLLTTYACLFHTDWFDYARLHCFKSYACVWCTTAYMRIIVLAFVEHTRYRVHVTLIGYLKSSIRKFKRLCVRFKQQYPHI